MKVGMPSGSSIGSAFGAYGGGLVGGGLYGLSQNILGSGFVGSLLAPILAASVIKGETGRTIATIAGFNAFSDVIGGLGGVLAGGSTQNTRGEM